MKRETEKGQSWVEGLQGVGASRAHSLQAPAEQLLWPPLWTLSYQAMADRDQEDAHSWGTHSRARGHSDVTADSHAIVSSLCRRAEVLADVCLCVCSP